MPNVTGEQEKAVRAAIKTQIEKYPAGGNVFDKRKFITSRQDFFAKLGKKTADNKTEIRFVEIRFIGFGNGDGFEKTPDCILQYQIHIFRQFADRADGTNSNDEFISFVLALRNEFLLNQDFAGGTADDGLSNDTFAQFGADTLVDVDGDFIDLRLDVTHKATC